MCGFYCDIRSIWLQKEWGGDDRNAKPHQVRIGLADALQGLRSRRALPGSHVLPHLPRNTEALSKLKIGLLRVGLTLP